MRIPKSVAETIANHVLLEVEGIDRMYLNVYQPKLQHGKEASGFFRFHRGEAFATALVMSRMTRKFVASIERFVGENDIPMIAFNKGQRKDDVALLITPTSIRRKASFSSARPRKKHPFIVPRLAGIPSRAKSIPGWFVRQLSMTATVCRNTGPQPRHC